MPQFDTSTYTSQLFWLIICFGLLYWILKNKILPQLVQIQKHRWDRTEGLKKKSMELCTEAENLQEQWKALIEDAQEKAQTLIRHSVQKSSLELEKKRTNLTALMQKQIADFKTQLEIQEQKAQSAILKAVFPLTIQAVLKLSQETLPQLRVEEEAQRILNQFKDQNNKTQRL